jgi:hypothetical protein
MIIIYNLPLYYTFRKNRFVNNRIGSMVFSEYSINGVRNTDDKYKIL